MEKISCEKNDAAADANDDERGTFFLTICTQSRRCILSLRRKIPELPALFLRSSDFAIKSAVK
ncbi:MAG: hypothetical protein IJ009_00905 [Clostridia bacterium]|nr:hypothetical protein [Clostridia bacterium]